MCFSMWKLKPNPSSNSKRKRAVRTRTKTDGTVCLVVLQTNINTPRGIRTDSRDDGVTANEIEGEFTNDKTPREM